MCSTHNVLMVSTDSHLCYFRHTVNPFYPWFLGWRKNAQISEVHGLGREIYHSLHWSWGNIEHRLRGTQITVARIRGFYCIWPLNIRIVSLFLSSIIITSCVVLTDVLKTRYDDLIEYNVICYLLMPHEKKLLVERYILGEINFIENDFLSKKCFCEKNYQPL